jgi:hypothetical protein
MLVVPALTAIQIQVVTWLKGGGEENRPEPATVGAAAAEVAAD